MTIFPEDQGLSNLYGSGEFKTNREKSPEAVLGVPALMPALIATLEAAEVLKVILNRGRILRRCMLHVYLETGQLNEFEFEDPSPER